MGELTETPPKKRLSLEKLLGFGWYQLLLVGLLQTIDFVEITNMSFMVFGGVIPTLSCTYPQTLNTSNTSSGALDQKVICKQISNGFCSNVTKASAFQGIAHEWDLVCDSVGAVYLTMSIQMAGVMVGAPFFGQISDLYGRKRAYIITLSALIITGLGSSFSPNVQIFTAFRFFIGFFMGGCITVGSVFKVEFLQEKHRLWVGCLGSPLGYAYFSMVAFLTQEWRKLALVNNLLGIPMLIALFFTKESPRWLIQKGRTEEAKCILRTVGKINRDKNSEEMIQAVIQKEVDKGHRNKFHSFWHLFYTKDLLKYSCALPLAWFSVSCISYGLLFNMGKLSGSPYLNGLMYGAARCAVALVTIILDVTRRNKLFPGRKHYHMIGLLVVSSACLTLFALSAAGLEKSLRQVFRFLSLIPLAVSGMVWMVVYLLSAELYPTPIRNLANSFCSFFARVGGIVAPQILFLSHAWSPAHNLIFGVLAVVDMIIFHLLLPETKNLPLPEKMPPKSEKLKWGKKTIPPSMTESELIEKNYSSNNL